MGGEPTALREDSGKKKERENQRPVGASHGLGSELELQPGLPFHSLTTRQV